MARFTKKMKIIGMTKWEARKFIQNIVKKSGGTINMYNQD